MVTTDDVRGLALSLPETEEHEHWGKCSFRVRNKIFAVIQPDGVSVAMKTTHDNRDAYTSMAPEVFHVPDSFAKLSYMMVRIDRIDQKECSDLLIQAWKLVSPKKLVKAYGESCNRSFNHGGKKIDS
ncbi:MmcQ/YjbR family DNA-binding protein [Brevibacillus invocatus]|uniref:MmcQ/YjbR family DNA-binding protein n=1 Tax=Brevibacillus invocatus TaxID=173959 RepID=A0A3M8BR37_9BACL|nr:MmcQ/YjbR family DNA-binding protein [Brevibacillus invocatus]RNB65870.1 MmcQ/YjbR family DNA-binding protein [Brevibacillus invocatus]